MTSRPPPSQHRRLHLAALQEDGRLAVSQANAGHRALDGPVRVQRDPPFAGWERNRDCGPIGIGLRPPPLLQPKKYACTFEVAIIEDVSVSEGIRSGRLLYAPSERMTDVGLL